ncbi:flagellar hook-associated protein FlgK [Alphaproteobacteria bacterium]|nr:flagellar hook-associated protein FlgK [Alphaproteobacteria bacterium]
MASLFDIGKSGLNSYRQALAVTGQNIANINTDGYKRREASLEEIQAGAGSINSVPDQSGLGVRVADVRRSFDEFLINKARTTASYAEAAEAYSSNISDLEDVLLPGEHNLGSMLAQFFDGLQEVSVAPADLAPRTVALEQANALADSFRQLATELNTVKKGIIDQANQDIGDLNGLISELSNLNRAIGSGSASKSNSALDARDALIDKISNYVEVTIVSNDDGSTSLTLGASGNGPAIVRHDKFAILKVVEEDKNLNFQIAEGTGFVPTSQVKNGSLKGLSDSFSKTSETMDKVDRLAFSFVRDVNAIHEQGINLEGLSGGKFFQMADIKSVESSQNLGSGAVVVNVTDYTIIDPQPLEITYDKTSNLWVGRNIKNQVEGSGASRISLSGMDIEFSGNPSHGDKFYLEPAGGSASAIGVVITRPHDIAAASKLLSSADPKNESAATMATEAIVTQPVGNVPNMTKVLSNGLSAVAGTTFRADGSAVIIPANVTDVDLTSLSQQSQLTFTVSDEKMKGVKNATFTMTDPDGNSKIYSFDLSYSTLNPDGSGYWTDMNRVADLLNKGVMTGTNNIDGDTTFTLAELGGYASGTGGQITISFSKNDITDNASLSFSNASDISGIVTSRNELASDIQIFTREGRHIAGSALTADEISDLFTTANGFNAGATYVDTYLNKTAEDGYLGTTVSNNTNATEILTNISELGTSRTITFDRLSNIDGNEESVNGTTASAETVSYSLTIGNITKKVSSADVSSAEADDIAHAMAKKFRSNAPIANLTGATTLTKSNTISVSAENRDILAQAGSLSIQYDGASYQLKQLDDGTIDITSSNQNIISLSYDPSTYDISETFTDFPNDGENVTVRFEGQDYTITMMAGELYVTGGEAGRLSASFNQEHRLHIWSNDGTLISDNITLPASAVIQNNSEAAARFGLTNGTIQPTASLTQQSIVMSIAEQVAGDASTYAVHSISGFDEAGLAALAGSELTISDGLLNLRSYEHAVSTTIEGSQSVSEVQSIAGFDASGLSNLAGQTITLSDGATTVSHKFTTAPIDIPSVVSALQAATGYSSLLFDVAAGSDALRLNYKDNGVAAMASFTQTSNAVTVAFSDTPTISEVALALQSHSSYAGLDFAVSTGTDALTLTYKTQAAVTTAPVAEINSFYNRDFNIKVNGANIVATHIDETQNLQATASAESLMGQRITLGDMPDEDLIVMLTGQGARKISATYDLRPAEAEVMLRDITVTVTDAANGIVDFVDTETGSTMATRTLSSYREASAKGFSIKLSGELLNDDKFHIAGNFDGVGDSRNLEAIIALQATNDNNIDVGGFQEVFGSMVAELGSSVKSSKLTLEAAAALRDASREAEASYSGVNLDTEASRLIEQQQAYQASARILSTARELFQTLMQSI